MLTQAEPVPVRDLKRFAKRSAESLRHPRAPLIIGLVVLCLAMSLLSDSFATPGNIQNILAQSAVVGIAAVGVTFIIITGGIDLSVGSNIALSGMVAATIVDGGVSGPLGIMLCIVVALAVGAFNGFSVAWLGLAPFIVTLAMLSMGRGLTLQISQGESVYDLPASLTWMGGGRLIGVPVPVFVMIITFIIGHVILSRSTLGHRIYAVGGNKEAARLSGIATQRVLFSVYWLFGSGVGWATRGGC